MHRSEIVTKAARAAGMAGYKSGLQRRVTKAGYKMSLSRLKSGIGRATPQQGEAVFSVSVTAPQKHPKNTPQTDV